MSGASSISFGGMTKCFTSIRGIRSWSADIGVVLERVVTLGEVVVRSTPVSKARGSKPAEGNPHARFAR